MDGHGTEPPKQSTAEMTAFVESLLQQMQTRFQTMSNSIITKIDEMGKQINELENSINDLRTEMGTESFLPPLDPKLKPKPESTTFESTPENE